MLTIYGMKLCPDCIETVDHLESEHISFEFLDFSDATDHLKKFLKLRDLSPVFSSLRGEEKIGIPCFVCDDGFVTLNLEEALQHI